MPPYITPLLLSTSLAPDTASLIHVASLLYPGALFRIASPWLPIPLDTISLPLHAPPDFGKISPVHEVVAGRHGEAPVGL